MENRKKYNYDLRQNTPQSNNFLCAITTGIGIIFQ